MGIASWVADHSAVYAVVMYAVCNTKPIRHIWEKKKKSHGWTGQVAAREDVVVDGGVSCVHEHTGQSLAL